MMTGEEIIHESIVKLHRGTEKVIRVMNIRGERRKHLLQKERERER